MDAGQIELVRESYARARRIAPHLAATFYTELFALDPALRNLFRRDMIALGKKLIDTLTFVVDHLDKPDAWKPAARTLAVRHLGFGVQAAHYDLVGVALLRTLKHELGPSFSPEMRAAWASAYEALAQEMRQAAYESTL